MFSPLFDISQTPGIDLPYQGIHARFLGIQDGILRNVLIVDDDDVVVVPFSHVVRRVVLLPPLIRYSPHSLD